LMDSATPERDRGDLPATRRVRAYRTAVAERLRFRIGVVASGEVGAPAQLALIAHGLLIAVINHEYQHDQWIGEVRSQDLAKELPPRPTSPLLSTVDGYLVIGASWGTHGLTVWERRWKRDLRAEDDQPTPCSSIRTELRAPQTEAPLTSAVEELLKAQNKGADVAALIDMLVAYIADEAQTAIDSAIAAHGNGRDIDKALAEMAKSQKELDKGKPDKAVSHYIHAWDKAQKAMKLHRHHH
jgi:hypothetical protein